MPSTYTTNLGIQKPANGEQSGTWGQTVNANSDILDRAVNGSLSLSLSGTSSTLTTLQGSVSDGQYKVLELTGSPSGTHTITIDPATAQTLYLVNNTTAQSVIFTQGSGGNVTIVAGASAIIYSSGAGATAKVTNITNVFAMSNVKITGGTITGITDLAVADGGTGASTLTGYVKGTGTAALTASATIPSTDITGLGTMAAQNASSVTITGGSITGITDLAVADGGTGASTGAGALSNFGLTATVAQLNFVAGVTSAIQTQIDTKAPLASPALTGTPTAPTASVGTDTTQIATTAFAIANATKMQKLGGTLLNGLSLVEFTGIPSNANTVILTLNLASMNTVGNFLVQLGTASGYVASGSTSLSASGGSTSALSNATNQLIWNDSAVHNAIGKMVFTKFEIGGAEAWVQNSAFLMSTSNIQYGSGSVVLSAPLTKLKVYTSAGSFDNGAAYLWWEA
jgi:hypothetical protein